jgi:hypothetical protein
VSAVDVQETSSEPVVDFEEHEWACPTCGFTRSAPITPKHEHDGVYVAFEVVNDDDDKPRRRRRGRQQ